MSEHYELMREFRTAQFRVVADACPDDNLDLSWDEDGSTRAGLESGKYIAFIARVRVIHDELGELSANYLGSCIYESFDKFMDHKECAAYNRELAARGEEGRCGSYFADMIYSAIKDARKRLLAIEQLNIKVRVQS